MASRLRSCWRLAGPVRYTQGTSRPGGEIGRRKGLKILFPETGVRVQVPPRAPKAVVCGSLTRGIQRAENSLTVCHSHQL